MKGLPRARRDLLATALDEEVVVYDAERQLAHSLNRTALVVWTHCNGYNSVADLQQIAGAELGIPVDAETIGLALRRLRSAHLLVDRFDSTPVSRRQLLGRAGRIGLAAVVTPVVASAFVPVAAAAASRPNGLPACTSHRPEDDGCSSLIESCVCSKTTAGQRVCINPSTALKKRTCKQGSDCPAGYFCIPRGIAPPRCIAPCAVPTCVC